MRTATRRTSTSRTIRTTRARSRPRNRRHHRQPRVGAIAATVLGLAGLFAVGAYLYPPNPRPTCVEVIGADRSESQPTGSVTEQWQDEMGKIIDRAARCEGIIIAEGVFHEPGRSKLRQISFHVDAVNRLDKEAKQEKLEEDAKKAIRAIMAQPATGGTDLIGWWQRVDNHLEGIAGDREVNVTLFTDGINTREPVRMDNADLSRAGVDALINRLRPDLPDCRGWRIAMLGVNATQDGGVPPSRAEGAERFWRAYFQACAGDLVRYDAAAQFGNEADSR